MLFVVLLKAVLGQPVSRSMMVCALLMSVAAVAAVQVQLDDGLPCSAKEALGYLLLVLSILGTVGYTSLAEHLQKTY